MIGLDKKKKNIFLIEKFPKIAKRTKKNACCIIVMYNGKKTLV